MNNDIFLSHCREDKVNVAFPLYRALIKLGFNVWIDRENITSGGDIYNCIIEAIQDSNCVISIINDPYLKRPWTRQELSTALEMEQTNKQILFPIYHQIDYRKVEKDCPDLKGRAFEALDADCFDISDIRSGIILDRFILWYFSNKYISFKPNRYWLENYIYYPNISQLQLLYEHCIDLTRDLRSDLIAYTNAVRYLLAILVDANPSHDIKHHQYIAERYCTEIADQCFKFDRPVLNEMLFSCRVILYVLFNDLKTLLNTI